MVGGSVGLCGCLAMADPDGGTDMAGRFPLVGRRRRNPELDAQGRDFAAVFEGGGIRKVQLGCNLLQHHAIGEASQDRAFTRFEVTGQRGDNIAYDRNLAGFDRGHFTVQRKSVIHSVDGYALVLMGSL